MGYRLHEVLVSPLVGGAALVALRLASAARRKGITTHAWVPGTGPAAEALKEEQVPCSVYDLPSLWASRPRQAWAWARMLPGFGLQRPVVHVHNPMVYRIMRPALAAARARVIVHFHLEPDAAEVQWTLASPPDHVVACAGYIAEKIRRLVGDRATACRISAIPNAVDASRFLPRDTASNAALRDPHVVLMLANLAPHKGQATAIRAVHLLKQRGVPVECWLAGEDRSATGTYERDLRRLSAELGIEQQVRFLGFRPDAPELLRHASAFLLPSTHEGLPLSVLEAQAAGVPVIGSPIPGILEVVRDGDTGFIAAPDDPAAYARRLQLLFERGDVRERITTAAAQQVAAEYGWERFEERMFDLYADVGGWTSGAGAR